MMSLALTPGSFGVRKFLPRLILGTPFIVLQYYKPSFSLYKYKERS
jgi:hypothetical protein